MANPRRDDTCLMGKTAIIGDVHGMTDMLAVLVAKLDLQAGDTLISVGDLVDKGPDPVGTVAYMRALSEEAAFDVVLVEANHEDRHIRYRRNLTVRPKIARQQAANAPELPDLMERLSEADWDFLESAVLFHRIPQHNLLVVHGGIPGNMETFPATLEEVTYLPIKAQRSLRQILRVRYISSDEGRFRMLGREEEGDPFWAEVYDGRFGHVVFGHQPWFDGPREFPHATGIDTGAVDGGALTALVVEGNGARSYVSVDSAAKEN